MSLGLGRKVVRMEPWDGILDDGLEVLLIPWIVCIGWTMMVPHCGPFVALMGRSIRTIPLCSSWLNVKQLKQVLFWLPQNVRSCISGSIAYLRSQRWHLIATSFRRCATNIWIAMSSRMCATNHRYLNLFNSGCIARHPMATVEESVGKNGREPFQECLALGSSTSVASDFRRRPRDLHIPKMQHEFNHDSGGKMC